MVVFWSGPSGGFTASPTFSCVRMSSTPGTARAALRSMRRMRPRAIELVTNQAKAAFWTGSSSA